mgnify:CR=1 FL=1
MGVPGRVTREDLYQLIATSTVHNLTLADLTPDARAAGITTGASPPADPQPGQLWWDTGWQVMRAFDDVLGAFLAIGPDIYEQPVVASHPIDAGCAVAYDWTQMATSDRAWVRAVTDPGDSLRCCGILSATAASGAAVPMVWWGFAVAAFSTASSMGHWGAMYVATGVTGYLRQHAQFATYGPESYYVALPAENVWYVTSGTPDAKNLSRTVVRFTGPHKMRLSS